MPEVLPGSKTVLFGRYPPKGILADMEIVALDEATKREKVLIKSGFAPKYAATWGDKGHLLYVHDGALFGVAFDPKRVELLGAPQPLLDDVAASSATSGGGQYSFSTTGTLVYLSGKVKEGNYPILLLGPGGPAQNSDATPLLVQNGSYRAPRFSPDGRRVAYLSTNEKGTDLWVYDLTRRTASQLTFLGNLTDEIAWAHDSAHSIYGNGGAIWWIRADGSGAAQKLARNPAGDPRPYSVAPAGPPNQFRLAYSAGVGDVPEIWTLTLDLADPEHPRPGTPEKFLAETAVVYVDPALSPDGKFLAYASTGKPGEDAEEVYVAAYPGPGGKWKVGAGKFPAWSPATRELLFAGRQTRRHLP